MATSQLDRIVKGAPPPNVSPDQVASAARRMSQTTNSSITAPHPPPLDPVSHLPSSPPQIYLNLLILEASLRAQYLSLRARLRLHVLLLGALALWTLTFTYLLFLRPREDGKGTGGSVYWMLDMMEKMAFVGGVVMWCLVWGTGIWDRGMRWPRRWVSVTNRGLRGFNMKVVVIKGSMWKELLGYLSLFGPFGYWVGTKGMRYEYLPRDIERLPGGEKDRLKRLDGGRDHWVEEDIAAGGDTLKLLLLPKPFSPDFREEWDTYRSAYWEKENERRTVLRRLIKSRDRDLARRQGGWLWWTGWRGWARVFGDRKPRPVLDATAQAVNVIREKGSLQHLKREKLHSHHHQVNSRSSSRSSTPTPDPETRPRRGTGADAGVRRTSSSQRGGQGPRKKVSGTAAARPSLRMTGSGSGDSSRPATPDSGLPLTSPTAGRKAGKRTSSAAVSVGSASENEAVKKEETPPTDVEIKQEPK